MILPRKVVNRIGIRYGKLTVVNFSHVAKTQGRNAYWNCVCDCGNKTIVSSSHLGRATNSCGCLAKELSSKRIKEIHNTGDHLYFIQCGPYIKIGRTSNIRERLAQVQTCNPYKVELINHIENGGYREKEFHKRFKDKHHSGEWFELDGCEVVDIKQ